MKKSPHSRTLFIVYFIICAALVLLCACAELPNADNSVNNSANNDAYGAENDAETENLTDKDAENGDVEKEDSLEDEENADISDTIDSDVEPISVEEQIYGLAESYFDLMVQMVTELDFEDHGGILADNTDNYMSMKGIELFTRAEVWSIQYSDEYNFDIVERELEVQDGKYIAKYTVNTQKGYSENLLRDSDGYTEKMAGIDYTFTITENNNGFIIEKVETNHFFYHGMEEIMQDIIEKNFPEKETTKELIDAAFKEKATDLLDTEIFLRDRDRPEYDIPEYDYKLMTEEGLEKYKIDNERLRIDGIYSFVDMFFYTQKIFFTEIDFNEDRYSSRFSRTINIYLNMKALEAYVRNNLWHFDYRDGYEFELIERNIEEDPRNHFTITYVVNVKTHLFSEPEDVYEDLGTATYVCAVNRVLTGYDVTDIESEDAFYCDIRNEIKDRIEEKYHDSVISRQRINEAFDELMTELAQTAKQARDENYPGLEIPDLEYEFDAERLKSDMEAFADGDNAKG